MVTRFESGLIRLNSVDKDSGSDSEHWEEPPVCQRMGVMVAFQDKEELDRWGQRERFNSCDYYLSLVCSSKLFLYWTLLSVDTNLDFWSQYMSWSILLNILWINIKIKDFSSMHGNSFKFSFSSRVQNTKFSTCVPIQLWSDLVVICLY